MGEGGAGSRGEDAGKGGRFKTNLQAMLPLRGIIKIRT
jgi:hypothetical protein